MMSAQNGSSLVDEIHKQVLGGVADIGLIELLRTPARLATYSAIQSPILAEYSLLIHKSFLRPKCATATCVNELDAFTIPTWVTFLCLLFVVVCGRRLSQRVAAYLQPDSKELCGYVASAKLDSTLPLEVAHHCEMTPTVRDGRKLVLSSTLVFILMGTVCCCLYLTSVSIVLPSQLTVEPFLAAPFSSVEQLLRTDFTVHTTTGVLGQLLASNDPELISLEKKMITAALYDDEFLQTMADFGKAGTRTTFLAPRSSYGRVAHFTCDFVEVLPNLHSASSSPYWFRRNSQLYQDFSERFQRVREAGIVELISERYADLYVDYFLRREGKVGALCEPRRIPDKPTVAHRTVGMDDVIFTFSAALAIALGAGFGSLAVEIIIHHRKRKGNLIMFKLNRERI
ncbi:hypothetical protein BV898_11113 [Hypsibius exemplaris]|uniref:Ionotropic glutamate receptor C-terminal domain-containing protein n=1 Tax=Hypsibius exemplaris TaxID=2072580 RepID=A0A1W0WHQ9_HYPEX|nr:hypothetical protein BV898_11113 [Hypsibius exemplaris]